MLQTHSILGRMQGRWGAKGMERFKTNLRTRRGRESGMAETWAVPRAGPEVPPRAQGRRASLPARCGNSPGSPPLGWCRPQLRSEVWVRRLRPRTRRGVVQSRPRPGAPRGHAPKVRLRVPGRSSEGALLRALSRLQASGCEAEAKFSSSSWLSTDLPLALPNLFI